MDLDDNDDNDPFAGEELLNLDALLRGEAVRYAKAESNIL